MMRASAAVGGWSTASTRSRRASSSRSRCRLRSLVEATARVEAHGVVPEELALAPLGHIPGEHPLHRLREVALAVRVVRCVHQHILTDEIDDCVGELLAFRDLDALEIAPAFHVAARLRLER